MCLVLHSAVEVQPFPLTCVPGQTHLGTGGLVLLRLQALHEDHTGAPLKGAGNKAGILFSLLARASIKFTAPVKAQGSLPCQQSQQSCVTLLRWQLLSHTDPSTDITHREQRRGLSCSSTGSKSTLLKVSIYSTGLGRCRDSFSPSRNCCKA